MFIKRVLASNLKRLRKERGLTQEALAARTLPDNSVGYRTIRDIERAKANPSLEKLVGLARALGVPITALLDGPYLAPNVLK